MNFQNEWHSDSGFPDQKVTPELIEPYILPLVEALNKAGFKTRASCQGHLTLMGFLTTYVSFNSSSIEMSESFERLLISVKLNLPWNLEASFGNDRELWWRLFIYNDALKTQPPVWLPKLLGNRWLSRYRKMMKDDIIKIIQMLESIK